MALPAGPLVSSLSMSQINTELGRASNATISLDTAENGGYGVINPRSFNRPNSANPASISEWYNYNHTYGDPDYWWRADYGLSTSGWTAYKGGLNFTFYNVSSANSTTGAYFNGSNSYGITSNTSQIDAKFIVMRLNNVDGTAGRTILGGTQNNIHEVYFTNITNNWYIVEAQTGGNIWGSLNGTIGASDILLDFVTTSGPIEYLDGSNGGSIHTVYFGTFPNRIRWQSGYQLYVGRRQQGNYGQFYLKELAIYTNWTLTEAFAIRNEMRSRWP